MLNSIDRRDDCGEKVLLDEKMMNVFVVVMRFNAVVESGSSEVKSRQSFSTSWLDEEKMTPRFLLMVEG